MQLHAGTFEAVLVGDADDPLIRVQIEHNGQIGQQVGRGPATQLLHPVDVEVATGTLVGQHRIDVTIADHHSAALQGG
mgnify:CR=1 FL=1